MWSEIAQAWSLLTLGSFLLVMVLVMAATENESPGLGLVFLLVWLVLLTLFTSFRPWAFAAEHWLLLLVSVPVYVALGAAWAIFRWSLFVHDPDNYGTKDKKLDPRESRYRDKLISWMSWWWASAIWWALRWPRKLVVALVDRMSGIFDRISEGARRS